MLKSEKIAAGAAWSLPGLIARTVRDDSKPVWVRWVLLTAGLFTIVPFYYMGFFLFFSHLERRKRYVAREQHRELVGATKNGE